MPSRFVGFYYQHAGGVRIRANGRISLSYTLYSSRGPTFIDITLRATGSAGDALYAVVTSSNDRRRPTGYHFTLFDAPPGIQIPAARGGTPFCDRAHPGECGA